MSLCPTDTTYRIGIDVGGTFTDVFLWASTGETDSLKVLTTPKDPSLGVVEALRGLADGRGLPLEEFAHLTRTIVHGTTVTTNATLTRGGPKVGLITTEGVRDALEMRRGIRERQYDNRYPNVTPMVPRHHRLTVPGRLDADGVQLIQLDVEAVEKAAAKLTADGVGAIAICFMHSYAKPDHERAAAAVVREKAPTAFVSVSSEVLPTIRFYDRVSTTVLDAYCGPVLRDYLKNLTRRLDESGFRGALLIMQSSGGVAPADATMKRPAATLLSGPAAGPRAAAELVSSSNGGGSCIVVDMGGTSFDASLVRNGQVELKAQGEIDRLRIALPMLDIVTIGAGGGSIGWIDAGGLLRMGPASAGADPGPACYDRGGTRPACTDANLVLGYLDPDFFAGGRLKLSRDHALKAIGEHVARPLDLSVEDGAAGMVRVINTNMAHGVREITVKRGVDPREFPLVVAGGAAGLHACEIARELDIGTIVVPSTASVLCAAGMMLADLQHDFVRSCVLPLPGLRPHALQNLAGELIAEGNRMLAAEGVSPDRVVHEVALDLRYLKQYHEVVVPISAEVLAADDRAAIAALLHKEHDRLYGYELSAEGTPIELINVRVRSRGLVEKPPRPTMQAGGADPSAALKGRRRAFVPETRKFAELSVYDGHRLQAGNKIAGPALIERVDTTVLVGCLWDAHMDQRGSSVLQKRAVPA